MPLTLVDRRQPEPLHEQVRRLIFEEIASGAYASGERLPTEREYSERFGISLAPVRAALAQLVQSGHLERTQGRGTFVVEAKVQYALRLLSSSTDSLRLAGVPFTTRVIACALVEAPADVAKELRLTSRARAGHLRRVLTVRGRPAILLESWLPPRQASLVVRSRDYFAASGSLYRLLRESGLRLARSQGQLDMSRAADAEAKLLSLPFGHPLFDIRALVTGPAGEPLEKSRGLYDADRFALWLDRSFKDDVIQ
jgi:GntR family transcriptional regulator